MQITDDIEGVGQRIKVARTLCGKSLVTLAALAGMSAQNWHRIENEQQRISMATLTLMADAIGVSVDCLVNINTDIIKIFQDQALSMGEKIQIYRLIRKLEGKSLGELSTEAGIAVQTWNRIERDDLVPSMNTLENIANALGVSSLEIMPK